MDLIKKEFKVKKKEYDKNIMAKNTKINDLMTELENTKTDLTYTSKKVNDAQDQIRKQDQVINEMHENYKKVINKHEKEKKQMKDQLLANFANEVKM